MTQPPTPSESDSQPSSLQARFTDALEVHVTRLRSYVEDTDDGRILAARLTTWLNDTQATLLSFGLVEAARDLALVRGQRDFMGDEYLESRADQLEAFLRATVRHVARGTFTLVDPDVRTRGARSDERSHETPAVSRRPSNQTPKATQPHVRVHIGDVVRGDKNVNTGHGAIVTGTGHAVTRQGNGAAESNHRRPDAAGRPTSATEAVADIFAPAHAGPVRRGVWRVLLIASGVTAIVVTIVLAVLPETSKTEVWNWLKSWF